MGATNVAQVYVHWTHLGHRERSLLAYLALVSLDAGRPPVYFGGWADAARAIGLDPEGNPGSARKNARQAFQRLAQAGALVSSGKAHAGRRAEYALTLDPARSVVATGTARGPHGREVTTWTEVERSTGQLVDKDRRIWERETAAVPGRETGAVSHKGDSNGAERGTGAVSPRRNDDPHQEHAEENSAFEVTTGPDGDDPRLRSAAVFLARRPDQGRHAVDLLPTLGFDLPERERVILAAQLEGWEFNAEDVTA